VVYIYLQGLSIIALRGCSCGYKVICLSCSKHTRINLSLINYLSQSISLWIGKGSSLACRHPFLHYSTWLRLSIIAAAPHILLFHNIFIGSARVSIARTVVRSCHYFFWSGKFLGLGPHSSVWGLGNLLFREGSLPLLFLG
jgi:hypothetical protein